jgi:Tfp pilus assembly protein PilX
MITIAVLLVLFFWQLAMTLLGLTPEQRAAAQARRTARNTERTARAHERASRQQQRQWHEAVARQKARGHAGFADEAAARAALRGRGGRPSNLDDRWF